MAAHPPAAPQPAPMQTTGETEAAKRTQLENAGGLPKSHPSDTLQSYNRETGQNETPAQHNKYLGTAVTTGMALGTGGTSLAEGIAANGLRAGLAPVVKGIGGSIAGKFIGREAGGMIGHPEAGATIGGLAGGLYGLGGGKIPMNHGELSELLEPPPKLPQGWTGEETAAPTVGIGSPSPTYQDYATNRGTEISRAMKQQPAAFGIGSPEPESQVGAPLPSYEDYAANRGKEIMSARRQQPDAFEEPTGVGAPTVAKPSRSTGVAIVPEPRLQFAGETPNYMASVPRPRLERLALSGKPGAATQLQQLGQPTLYIPRGADIEAPSLEGLRQPEVAPRWAYRAHDVGNPEFDPNAPAHATLSPEEAADYRVHRENITGRPQTVSRTNLNSLVPDEFQEIEGPRESPWVKFHRQQKWEPYEP
jgi:hypothetical protein